jgi:signal transduction histidine kinase
VTTRRKHEEELMKARNLKAIGRLASGIAHEINNPLTNASLNLQMFFRKSDKCQFNDKCQFKEGCLEKLKNVERNVEKAANIAKELLLFSRQEELEGILIDVNERINGALVLLEYKLKGITIQKNLQSVASIIGDPVKIEQVFLNLFNNSKEAMGESGTISIHSYEEDNMVVVDVTDTGPGIPAEIIDRIFEPFFTTKEIGEGTGLGLSICYGIVSRYNGKMDISTIGNKGTIATIKLPFAEV